MTEERLTKLNDMESDIKKMEEKVSILKREDFKLTGIIFDCSYSSRLLFTPDDIKIKETIYEMVTIYYEKRLAILKKRFEVL